MMKTLQKCGKKLCGFGRKMLIDLTAVACLVLSLGGCGANHGYAGGGSKIAYNAGLAVSMTEKGLTGQLKGGAWDGGHTKRVEVEKDGQKLTYLFFYLTGNSWGAVFANKNSGVEYIICPEDKGAGEVDYVYYYTGDDTGIEMMEYEQLQEVIKESVLLWSSEENQL